MATILVLSGCAGSDDNTVAVEAATEVSETTVAEATEETSGEPFGDQMLDPATFAGQATSVDGETVELSALADKDLVLWFWAPW